jgi:hypothetical protein
MSNKKSKKVPGLSETLRNLVNKQKEKCDPTSCCRNKGNVPHSISKIIAASKQ